MPIPRDLDSVDGGYFPGVCVLTGDSDAGDLLTMENTLESPKSSLSCFCGLSTVASLCCVVQVHLLLRGSSRSLWD